MKFTIPGKPIPQTRARISRNFMYDPLFQVKKNIRLCVKEQLPEGFEPYTEPVEVRVVYFLQIPKAWPLYRRQMLKDGKEIPHDKTIDLDNLLKQNFDALNGIIWSDDRIIWKIDAKKVWAFEGKTSFEVIQS